MQVYKAKSLNHAAHIEQVTNRRLRSEINAKHYTKRQDELSSKLLLTEGVKKITLPNMGVLESHL